MSALVDRLLIGKYWPNNHDHMFFFGGAWKLFRIVLCPIWVAKFKGKEWLAQYSNFVRYSLSLASLVALSIGGMSWITEGSSSSGNGFGVSFCFSLSFFFAKKDRLLHRCGNDKNYFHLWYQLCLPESLVKMIYQEARTCPRLLTKESKY